MVGNYGNLSNLRGTGKSRAKGILAADVDGLVGFNTDIVNGS